MGAFLSDAIAANPIDAGSWGTLSIVEKRLQKVNWNEYNPFSILPGDPKRISMLKKSNGIRKAALGNVQKITGDNHFPTRVQALVTRRQIK